MKIESYTTISVLGSPENERLAVGVARFMAWSIRYAELQEEHEALQRRLRDEQRRSGWLGIAFVLASVAAIAGWMR